MTPFPQPYSSFSAPLMTSVSAMDAQQQQRQQGKSLPKTRGLRISLSSVAFVYLALGIAGAAFLAHGGRSWDGDTNTLTTVLAVLGALLTFLSRVLIAQCRQAGLQREANRAITESVSLSALNRMDIAVRGSVDQAMAEAFPWGPLYRGFLPSIAIITSAVLKKVFATRHEAVSTTITGIDASFFDPIAVGKGVRGLAWAGAILYNTTASMGVGMNPAQRSWTYVAANMSDDSGLETVQFSMPSLPMLVATGSSGYMNYSTSSIPTLVCQVQCSSNIYEISNPEGSIQNSNNDIYLGTMTDGTATIQVATGADIGWSCLARVGKSDGNATFISDTSGNWNISRVEVSSGTNLDFSTTPVRWNMMADIISDALGQTAGTSGFKWNTDTSESPGYSSMLLGTRLSFATAVLAYSESRADAGPSDARGTAYSPVEKVVLQANWALILTTILLLSQALVAASHIFGVGNHKMDFSILQVMEMREATTMTKAVDESGNPILDTEGAEIHFDAGPPLQGHCSKFSTDIAVDYHVAIRTKEGPDRHLGFLYYGNQGLPLRWRGRIHDGGKYQ